MSLIFELLSIKHDVLEVLNWRERSRLKELPNPTHGYNLEQQFKWVGTNPISTFDQTFNITPIRQFFIPKFQKLGYISTKGVFGYRLFVENLK